MLTIFGANGKSGRALITLLRQNGFSDGLAAAIAALIAAEQWPSETVYSVTA